MASLILERCPKNLDIMIEGLVAEYITSKQVILGAIVLFSLSKKDDFDSSVGKQKIVWDTDKVIEPEKFSIGDKATKKMIQDWGIKSGRKDIKLQVLYIISRFFEKKFKLPKKFLEMAALLR